MLKRYRSAWDEPALEPLCELVQIQMQGESVAEFTTLPITVCGNLRICPDHGGVIAQANGNVVQSMPYRMTDCRIE